MSVRTCLLGVVFLVFLLGTGAARAGEVWRGSFAVEYVRGHITAVKVVRSTGQRDRDVRAVKWIKAKFRVKAGASGRAILPVVWRS